MVGGVKEEDKGHISWRGAEGGVEVDVWDKIVVDILRRGIDLMNSIDIMNDVNGCKYTYNILSFTTL